jgi:hypothetical protein
VLENPAIFDEEIALVGEANPSVIERMQRVRNAMLRLFRARFDHQASELLWVPYLNPLQVEMGHLKPDEVVVAHQRLLAAVVEVARQQRHAVPQVEPTVSQDAYSMTSPDKWMLALKRSKYGRKLKKNLPSADIASNDDEALRRLCDSEFIAYLKHAEIVTLEQDPLD